MERLFGGSPLAVLVRLAVVSLIVGIVLTALGIGPYDIFAGFDDLLRWFADFGRDWLDSGIRWLVMGAAIVVPIWVIWRAVQLLFGGKR